MKKGEYYKVYGADGKYLKRIKLTSTGVSKLRNRFPKSTFKK